MVTPNVNIYCSASQFKGLIFRIYTKVCELQLLLFSLLLERLTSYSTMLSKIAVVAAVATGELHLLILLPICCK